MMPNAQLATISGCLLETIPNLGNYTQAELLQNYEVLDAQFDICCNQEYDRSDDDADFYCGSMFEEYFLSMWDEASGIVIQETETTDEELIRPVDDNYDDNYNPCWDDININDCSDEVIDAVNDFWTSTFWYILAGLAAFAALVIVLLWCCGCFCFASCAGMLAQKKKATTPRKKSSSETSSSSSSDVKVIVVES